MVAKIEPVRTLKGHLRGISDTAIVARGRNVLSSSSDGTVRLWDVSTGQEIRTIWSAKGQGIPVNKFSLGERARAQLGGGQAGEAETLIDEREVETGDKIVWLALQNGQFQALDLRSKQSAFYEPVEGSSKPLTSIDYAPDSDLLATGSSNGVAAIYDTRSLSDPFTSFTRSTSSIEDLAFMASTSDTSASYQLAVATADGLALIAQVGPNGTSVEGEIVGGDCDAMRFVKVVEANVWTACDDGVVRMYKPW
jgi:proteasomal ATPase-associated factor 1